METTAQSAESVTNDPNSMLLVPFELRVDPAVIIIGMICGVMGFIALSHALSRTHKASRKKADKPKPNHAQDGQPLKENRLEQEELTEVYSLEALETQKHKKPLVTLGLVLLGVCAVLMVCSWQKTGSGVPRRPSTLSLLRNKRPAEVYGRYHKYTKETLPADMIDLGAYSRYYEDCYMAANPFEYFCIWNIGSTFNVNRYKLEGWFLFRWSLDDLIKNIDNPKFVLKLQEFLKMHNIDRDISEYLPKTPQ